MPIPFISDSCGIDLSGFTRYLECASAAQIAADCGAWEADPRDALVLGDLCRHMLGRTAQARAFYAWALAQVEEHPEAAREDVDLAARYAVLGNLCSRMPESAAAMDAWAKSIDHGSDDPVPYLRLARALESAGRLQEARARIDGLFALPAARLEARLDAEQRGLADRLRATLPVAHGSREGQDLRARVRDLLLVSEQAQGKMSGIAEQRRQALR